MPFYNERLNLDSTTIECQSIEDSVHLEQDIFPLEKHVYPLWIRASAIATIGLFLVLTPIFFRLDLPYQRQIHAKIAKADQLFLDKEYIEAAFLYQEILDGHPKFKDGKKKIASACFAMTDLNSDYYSVGLHYLAGEQYKDSEIENMQSFLPEEYKNDFKLQFKKVK